MVQLLNKIKCGQSSERELDGVASIFSAITKLLALFRMLVFSKTVLLLNNILLTFIALFCFICIFISAFNC